MQNGQARPRPGRTGEGAIAKLAAKYSPEALLDKFVQGRTGRARLAAFRAMAYLGKTAVPALMNEIITTDSPMRGTATKLLRKIVEANPQTDWDNALPGQGAGRLKERLAAAVEDQNEEVALNAAGALGTIMKRLPCDGIGKFGERRVSIMELGKGMGENPEKCGAAVRDSMQWLADGEEV
jgi:hypothetical protein